MSNIVSGPVLAVAGLVPASNRPLQSPSLYDMWDDTDMVSEEEISERLTNFKQDLLSETQGKYRDFFDDSMRFKYVKELADRYHFFHPMLEFIEVFWLRDGFDIICGNPPWIMLGFDELDVISEKYPEVVLRNVTAAQINLAKQKLFGEDKALVGIYLQEQVETFCTSTFLDAYCNYPFSCGD